MKKRILLQGATGSIGSSVLSVLREQREHFELCGISVNTNLEQGLKIAAEFGVESIAVCDDSQAENLKRAAKSLRLKQIYVGSNACAEQAQDEDYSILVNALMGSAGIAPTMAAIERGKRVALANKETLVAAGPLVLERARKCGAELLPIDSEHSAIYQCLKGEDTEHIRSIWLTTSGGPFWGRPWSSLSDITPAMALAHPTWRMGAKITIDSSTLFNKGLEVIETQRLFGVRPEQIKVVAHRQSIIHSMVEFVDGSFKAQLSAPDMRLPILYALSSPDRFVSELVPTPIATLKNLTFEPVEAGMFPLLGLAIVALERGGTVPAALSAADEVAVSAFLHEKIGFTQMADILERVVCDWPDDELTTIEAVQAADTQARLICAELINRSKVNRMAEA